MNGKGKRPNPEKLARLFLAKTHPVKGAGLLFFCGSRILLIRRGDASTFAGFWGIPGGKVEEGESFYEAAKREAVEEIGGYPPFDVVGSHRSALGCVRYTTYIVTVNETWVPVLNEEHTDFQWIEFTQALHERVHPGLKEVLRYIKGKTS